MDIEVLSPAGGKATGSVETPAKTSDLIVNKGRRGAPLGQSALIVVTVLAAVVLVGPLTVGGIWDPIELRVADLASRIASTLFHAQHFSAMSDVVTMPTLGELGRGELAFTSIAIGFRVFGVHDWAGRLPLASWVVAALVAQVIWVSRFVNRRAAAWSALVFCTMPLVFFQARFMLGDAATIGTMTITFVLLSLACLRAPDGNVLSVGLRVSCLVLGLAMALLGVLARGLALGVVVPLLAVGIASLAADRTSDSRNSQRHLDVALRAIVLSVGLLAGGFVTWMATRVAPQRGILLVLQGMSFVPAGKMATFDSVVTQLGHGLFPWSAMLPFALLALFNRLKRRGTLPDGHAAIVALTLLVTLTAATQTWLTSLGASLPYPALAALAAVLGVWLDAPNEHGISSRSVFIGVIALEAMFLADFENLPDKILAAAAATDAHIPASFRTENLSWLRGCAVLVGVSFATVGVQVRIGIRRPRSALEVLRGFVRRLRNVWGGQMMFFALLLETSLITGALLVMVTRWGAPFQRIRTLSTMQLNVLTWAWLSLPALVVVGVGAIIAYEALIGLYSRGSASCAGTVAKEFKGGLIEGLLVRFPRLRDIHLARATMLGLGLFVAALSLSLGWANRLSQQLSPRRALSRYDALSRPGEPLGLLGVRPQITHYYSSQRPEVLLDAEEAADWLLKGTPTMNRWLIVKGDQFPRVNAAFRDQCHCFRNVPVIDARSSEMFLVSNRRATEIPSDNPLDAIVLEHEPKPQQKISGDFGGQVAAIGWEIVSEAGRAVAELRVGRRYKLRLYYRVLARPTLDWETFVHIDGSGRRFNGDHETTQGKYPTTSWRPGDFIVDEETIVLDPSFSGGNYELFFGFFKGARRLEVNQGRADENRLLAGTIRVH